MTPHRRISLIEFIKRDFKAALDNDPAASGPLAPIEVALTYPGFHAILMHRITHRVHRLGIPLLPRMMSMVNRFFTGVEIHQAARIGPGFFIDHGMGVVIGETAEIGTDCMLFHGVTLGGTGKQCGKRHPTLMDGVVIGAGAKILGAITVGKNTYVGGNSVVLQDVPDNSTVVGIPGRVVRRDGKRIMPKEHALDHQLPDPVKDRFVAMENRVDEMERELLALRRRAKFEDELPHESAFRREG